MNTKVFLYLINNKPNALLEKENTDSSLLSFLFRSNKKDSYALSVSEDSTVVHVVPNGSDGTCESMSYGFDHIFDDSSSIDLIYESTSYDLVTRFFQGNGKFTNASLLIFGSTSREGLEPLFGTASENDGIIHKIVEGIFKDMNSRQGCYEVSCSVSELHGHELKDSQDDEGLESVVFEEEDIVFRGNKYFKCNNLASIFDVLNTVKKLDHVSRLVTVRVQDLDKETCGLFRIIFLPANELDLKDIQHISAVSSLEEAFISGIDHNNTETSSHRMVMTDILKSLIGKSNCSIILSSVGFDRQSAQALRLLRLGTAIKGMVETASFEKKLIEPSMSNDDVNMNDHIPDTLVINENVDYEYGSVSQLSLRASMINSSLMKLDIGYEDKEKEVEIDEREGPVYDSSIFINLGKHLYEENEDHVTSDQAIQTDWSDSKVLPKPSLATRLSVAALLFMLTSIIGGFFVMTRRTESFVMHQCELPIFSNNTPIDYVNFGHYEATRQIISFVQEVDMYLTQHKDFSDNFKYVSIVFGMVLLTLVFMIFSSINMVMCIVSIIRSFFKKTNYVPKTEVRRNKASEKNLNKKSMSPYLKHPRIMSPIDSSNIFMSRYAGEVVTNHGTVVEVVRSSRFATPSPGKYSTPSSREKTGKPSPNLSTPMTGENVKMTPIKHKVPPLIKEENKLTAL